MSFYQRYPMTPDVAVGYLAKRVFQTSAAVMEAALAEEGMTYLQWSALVVLRYGAATTCHGLARELSHDRGATTRLIDGLEERGLITRRRNDADRRLVDLVLTPEGERLAQAGRDRAAACWNVWLDGWEDGDVHQLIGLLQRLRDTIRTSEPSA